MTQIQNGSNQANKFYSAALFAAWMQKNSRLKNLSGDLPKNQSEAESVIRLQSSNKLPIVKIMELNKEAGDEILVDLINPYNAVPIMGDNWAEGKGGSLKFSDDRLRINQARFPIDCGGKMSQQRTKWRLREIAKAQGEALVDRYLDQMQLVHMSGARGFHNNIEWAVPLAADPGFSDVVVNRVKAPTRNRHFMVKSGGGLQQYSATAGAVDFTSADGLTMDGLDAIRTLVETMPLPPPPVMFEGDVMANDDPIRVLLVSPDVYTNIIQKPSTINVSASVRDFQAKAYQRAPMDSKGTKHPLFMGDVLLWNGILVVKMPKPIRFYAGNPINYCTSEASETETTTDVVPSAFTVGGVPKFAVDRSILLGGQALALAMGGHMESMLPFFWSEKELDHANKMEVLIGIMNGMSKIRFGINFGDKGILPTDYGVIAIDSVVSLTPNG